MTVMEIAPPDRVYNVGGGSETTLREIVQTCERITGETLDVHYRAAADGDVRRTAADTSRIFEETGWQPEVCLEDGLTSQLAWTMSRRAFHDAPALL
jgi:UDP-glucose 4-epimerase